MLGLVGVTSVWPCHADGETPGPVQTRSCRLQSSDVSTLPATSLPIPPLVWPCSVTLCNPLPPSGKPVGKHHPRHPSSVIDSNASCRVFAQFLAPHILSAVLFVLFFNIGRVPCSGRSTT